MSSSIKKNLGYQTLYQILAVCLPLFTSPYLSRVLGAEQLGVYSFSNSVVLYFTLFAMVGTVNYGTRSIAAIKNDPQKCGDTFWSIFIFQVFMSFCSIALYCVYLLLFCRNNRVIFIIQTLQIVNCLIDINWLFFGLEEFKLTVSRSIVVKIISFVLLFVLVRSRNDLWIYALLMTISALVNQAVLWIKLPNYCHFRTVRIEQIKEHIKPNLVLFVPLLAMSVYHIMDKTMLGTLSTFTQSGYYYNADKVINIPIGVFTGVGTVMLPRMSALIGGNKKNEFNSLFNTSIRMMGLVSAAMCCGIAAIAKEFTPFFFGNGYDDCIVLIIVLAPVLFIKGFSLISRNLYLIPNKMEKILTVSVVAGAVVNLIVNIILIPKMGALGAVVGTLAAEIVSCIWQYGPIVKEVRCFKSLLSGIMYFVIGIFMFFVVRLIANNIHSSNFIKLVIEVLSGVIIYGVLCFLFWKISKNTNAFRLLKSMFKR